MLSEQRYLRRDLLCRVHLMRWLKERRRGPQKIQEASHVLVRRDRATGQSRQTLAHLTEKLARIGAIPIHAALIPKWIRSENLSGIQRHCWFHLKTVKDHKNCSVHRFDPNFHQVLCFGELYPAGYKE
jgi:hypothetical protein